MEIFWRCLGSFVCGGVFCLIGQILIDYTKLTPARILVAYVVGGVALTAIGVYEPLVKLAGAGATVPLTGFGYTLAKGVEKAVAEQGAIGILSGGMTATAAGITAAIVFGYVVSLFAKSRAKG
ncbi:MAG: stage V sporulation protein AE [Oscillospiraceae bacterium]